VERHESDQSSRGDLEDVGPGGAGRPATASATGLGFASAESRARGIEGVRAHAEEQLGCDVLGGFRRHAGLRCWDAKYAYWQIRPSQLDPEFKPLFPPPNHPSYPAAHGCLSTAAATTLARLFPRDAEAFLALGRQTAEARMWAGIHYRSDIEAGQALGRAVSEQVLARVLGSAS
jgi:hypothetical protein